MISFDVLNSRDLPQNMSQIYKISKFWQKYIVVCNNFALSFEAGCFILKQRKVIRLIFIIWGHCLSKLLLPQAKRKTHIFPAVWWQRKLNQINTLITVILSYATEAPDFVRRVQNISNRYLWQIYQTQRNKALRYEENQCWE